jgi:lysophospholipase L1-like esterase
MTYGAITARALDADYYGICRSGIGIWQGYGGNTDFTMPKFYDEVIMNSSKKWDFERIQPQLVSIDLGANDLSANLDSAKFVTTYKLFLERIRKNYPKAKIVCIAGPSAPGAEWEKWKSLLHATMNETGKDIKELYYFEFGTFEPNGSDYHPNIPEHMKMADELIPYLKNLMNW